MRRKIRRETQRASVQPGDAQDGRRAARRSSTSRRTSATSRAWRSSASSCAAIRTTTVGAHLFGTIGEVTREGARGRARYAGVALGDRVGQSGIEYTYDRYLRGRNGASRIQVDALGRPKGELAVRDPAPGKQLRLSIDLAVQKAGQQALASFGKPGAFVALDPRSGEVLGLGSNPSFDPNVFAKALKQLGLQAAPEPGQRRAAREPRHPGPVPDGLDVQADHRRPRRSRAG